MTIQIELSPEGEARLRDRAREAGGKPEVVAALLLEEALSVVPDPDAHLTAEQWAAIEAGIARGDADFAAGRSSSAEDVYARLEKKHGVTCFARHRCFKSQ